jgi:hypothetical protein
MSTLRWTAVLSGLVVLGAGGAFAVACSETNDEAPTCDPATDPTCTVDGGDDGTTGDGTTIDSKPGDGTTDGTPGDSPPGDGSVTDTIPPDAIPPLDGSPPLGCTSDGLACTTPAQCCGGTCTGGKCAPLSAVCKTLGNTCTAGTECCSTFCASGICSNPSYCVQKGDACKDATQCCTGTCNKATGATWGTCGEAPPGPTYCSEVDGMVCTDCTACCSRVCAPYGLTGVKICQPAEGCHVVGDLCRRNEDCCGSAGTGLPGAGNVTCEIAPGATIGICRNPLSCNPEGAVCHYKSAAVCGTSSARADCCDGLGAGSGVCRPDKLGVPRCYGGEPCHKTGETCADSSGCCDGTPCVPDATGVLRCGTGVCIPVTGPCTVDADCCVGGTCTVPLGSVKGTCTPVPPPPGSDAGTDASTTDALLPDGAIADTASPDTATPPTCSLYGQSCKADGDCCSGVPCTSPTGTACAGATGCTCRDRIF